MKLLKHARGVLILRKKLQLIYVYVRKEISQG